MDCLDFTAELDRFVDGQTEPAASAEMRAHEALCEPCAAKARLARFVDSNVATAILEPVAPDEVWTKISKSIAESPRPFSWNPFQYLLRPAMALSAAGAIAAGLLWPQPVAEYNHTRRAPGAPPAYGQAYVGGNSAMSVVGGSLDDPTIALLTAIKASKEAFTQAQK